MSIDIPPFTFVGGGGLYGLEPAPSGLGPCPSPSDLPLVYLFGSPWLFSLLTLHDWLSIMGASIRLTVFVSCRLPTWSWGQVHCHPLEYWPEGQGIVRCN